jgi:hypothetical protein
MGARFNWIFHPGFRRGRLRPAAALCQGPQGHPARHRARGDRPRQSDRGGLGRPTGRASARPRTGSAKAIPACAETGQLNKALAGRQWFYPKDTPWRSAIAKKSEENAAMIRPQIHDDEAPANYYRALRDVAAWMPKNAFLSAEGAGTMDIGLTPSCRASTPVPASTPAPTARWVRPRPGHRRLRRAPGPAGHPPLRRLGDRLLGHGDGDAGRYNFPAKNLSRRKPGSSCSTMAASAPACPRSRKTRCSTSSPMRSFTEPATTG